MGIVPSDRQFGHSGKVMADVDLGDIADECSSEGSKICWSRLSRDPDRHLRLPVKFICQGEAPREKSPVARLLYHRSPCAHPRRPVPREFRHILRLDRLRSKLTRGS